jgi:hypothetical protein
LFRINSCAPTPIHQEGYLPSVRDSAFSDGSDAELNGDPHSAAAITSTPRLLFNAIAEFGGDSSTTTAAGYSSYHAPNNPRDEYVEVGANDDDDNDDVVVVVGPSVVFSRPMAPAPPVGPSSMSM